MKPKEDPKPTMDPEEELNPTIEPKIETTEIEIETAETEIETTETEIETTMAGLLDTNGEVITAGPSSKPVHLVPVSTSAFTPAKAMDGMRLLPKSSPLVVSANAYPATPQLHDSLTGYRKRTGADVGLPNNVFDSKRARKSEKGGKGLRHFSTKVCEKVQKKGVTTYNEVADELVEEFSNPRHMSASDQQYDQKNIRRRVYDALNVLMAINIISKEKKEIRWIGLPTNSAQECRNLEAEKQRRLERIKVKKQQLRELMVQQVAFKNLVEQNRQKEAVAAAAAGAGQGDSSPQEGEGRIQLPFIIVNTSKKTVIDCNISSDKYEYLFKFNNTFQIHDDIEVLKRMGLAYGLNDGTCTPEDLEKVKAMLAPSLQDYVDEMFAEGAAQQQQAQGAMGGLPVHVLAPGTEDSNPSASCESDGDFRAPAASAYRRDLIIDDTEEDDSQEAFRVY